MDQMVIKIPNVKNIIAVASGKGGVGKSTVSVNLALALGKAKQSVGLLDADLFGPSIPRMMNLIGDACRPILTPENKIKPVLSYGVECMSIGMIQAKEGESIVWKGLMVQKAIEQLLFQVQWNSLDYLIVDLPPGTGDIQLSLCQKALVDGVVLVSTPQEVAISDLKRAADMFKTLKVSILGIVENMNSFICPHCQEESLIFTPSESKTSLSTFAESFGIPIASRIPIDHLVCSKSDDGVPIVISHPDHLISKSFSQLAQFVMKGQVINYPK